MEAVARALSGKQHALFHLGENSTVTPEAQAAVKNSYIQLSLGGTAQGGVRCVGRGGIIREKRTNTLQDTGDVGTGETFPERHTRTCPHRMHPDTLPNPVPHSSQP